MNVLLEELVHHRYELPGFRTLELAAIGARERVNLGYYRSISHALTPTTRALIDDLLRAPENSRFTGWQSLKREPGRPTNKEVRFYLQHIRMLQQLAEQLPRSMCRSLSLSNSVQWPGPMTPASWPNWLGQALCAGHHLNSRPACQDAG